jgi:hypothetical protein
MRAAAAWRAIAALVLLLPGRGAKEPNLPASDTAVYRRHPSFRRAGWASVN